MPLKISQYLTVLPTIPNEGLAGLVSAKPSFWYDNEKELAGVIP